MSDVSDREARTFAEWAALPLSSKKLHAQGIGFTLTEFQEKVLEPWGLEQGPFRIAAKLTTNIEDWLEVGHDLQSLGYKTCPLLDPNFKPDEHFTNGGGI